MRPSPQERPDLYECETCSAKAGSPMMCGRCLMARSKAGKDWVGPRWYYHPETDRPKCTDCGTAPMWWWAWANICKRCATKGGQPDTERVDVDKVLAYFGGSEARAREFLEEVR